MIMKFHENVQNHIDRNSTSVKYLLVEDTNLSFSDVALEFLKALMHPVVLTIDWKYCQNKEKVSSL